jgi:hypothetical protein
VTSGSDAEFIEACITYWCLFDTHPDAEYRRLLHRSFLLAWGGKLRWRDGFFYVKGGLEPVRISL